MSFTVNTHRVDPYKNFKFRILMDNKPVLGVNKISALTRITEVVPFRSGGDNSSDSKSPGRTSYEAITLERGRTHSLEFEKWANVVNPYGGDASKDLVGYKRELSLEFLNERGQPVMRYFLHKCWVSEYTALPDLDANENGVAIESIKIELEGWERDSETKEPNEADAVPNST